eukprot:CAMPEP_0117054042 /NCGR_PEP_ID=MMETSP0472-20121206/37434_1 /TAXON_ID=693140 ORGANISM="Tiarina fusus, Strain LIS" /NCGR_SAMPLE_ID=MMETSP0472 /ASSEMBLY_ACC=CAM_ASM_000603 /LENGTH=151 /DNA_ID=CAMNT_0004769439 /DNA_START=20 /DNA_END=475 /DNA_ORIENTATION=-
MEEVQTASEPIGVDSTEGDNQVLPNTTLDTSQPLDPKMIDKVQKTAENLAKELDDLMSSVTNSLHSICAFSSGYMNIHKEAMDEVGGSVSAGVAGMYEFINKAKHLNDDLNGVEEIHEEILIHEEIKDIQKTLDILEALSARLVNKIPSTG